MMLEGEEEKHESYGMAGFSRVQGCPGALFGSSIRHNNFVRLRICRASRRRGLNTYWYHGREEIVEVDLSPTQFADLLTSMNVGDGVPCTIRYLQAKKMKDCPAVDQRQLFEAEFDERVQKATADAAKLMEEANAILAKPTILKADREQLKSLLYHLNMDLRSNLPFVQSQFNEAMEKTVTEAKGEVEAFVQTKVSSLGIEALRRMSEGGGVLPQLEDAR